MNKRSHETPAEPQSDDDDAQEEKRQRKRGIRHRVAEAGPASSSSSAMDQPLCRSLKKDWALGLLSSAKVQEYAWGAAAQGSEGLEDLARAGNEGRNPGNIQRALISALGMPEGSCDFTWAEIPMEGHARPQPHPFLLPHQVLSALHKKRPELFKSAFAPSASEVREFWIPYARTPFVTKHPVVRAADWDVVLPFGFHGDAGPFSKNDGLFCLSFNGLLGEGQTMRKRFLATVICDSKKKRDGSTMEAIWRIFGWSLSCIASGTTPHQDWLQRPIEGGGQPLAGRYRGVVVQARGDWEFFAQYMGMPRWDNPENCCWMCQAGMVGPSQWTAWGVDAAWRPTRKTHESWLADLAADGKPVPAPFRHITGLRLECVCPDIMHVADLGVSAHVLGNVFWEVITSHAFGEMDQRGQIEALHADMKAWYSRTTRGISKLQGKLTVSRIKTTRDWPKLKAKAAACRHLMKYGVHLATRFNSGSLHDRRRLAVTKLMARFYEIVDTDARFFTAPVLEELKRIGQEFMGCYIALSIEAAESVPPVHAWKLVPKFHIWQHLAEWVPSIWGNPRFFWTYCDEDLIGSMTEIGASCHPNTLPITALFKWLVYIFET